MAARYLQKGLQQADGGRGVLPGGVPGVESGTVVILGDGVAGTNAAEIAIGLRADVTSADRLLKRLREPTARFGNRVKTACATAASIESPQWPADAVSAQVMHAAVAPAVS